MVACGEGPRRPGGAFDKELNAVKKGTLFLLILCALCLSSCALLPEEEAFERAPVIRDYQAQSYKLAFAERGDLIKTVKVSCAYVPVQSEKLAFQVGGEYIDEIFVSTGDSVKKGQVLGQLRLNGAQEQIEACRKELESLDLRLKQLDERQSLEDKKVRVQYEGDAQALEEALRALEERYALQRQSLEDSRLLTGKRMAEYEKRLAERQLVAGFDGTVTYVRSFSEGARSTLGERVITLADSTLSLFRAETEYWDLFAPGETRVIVASKREYEAVVVTEEELGLKSTEKTEGKRANVYFKLLQPAPDLEDNDRGSLELILDERRDVVLLPEKAISRMGDMQVVYYLDEEGIRRYREVQTGLEANGLIEIVSGVREGDAVIAE